MILFWLRLKLLDGATWLLRSFPCKALAPLKRGEVALNYIIDPTGSTSVVLNCVCGIILCCV